MINSDGKDAVVTDSDGKVVTDRRRIMEVAAAGRLHFEVDPDIKGLPDKDFEAKVIDAYLDAQKGILAELRWLKDRPVRNGRRVDAENDTVSQLTSLCWSMMRSARVFCLRPEMYGRFYHAADVFTDTEICGSEAWLPPQPGGSISKAEAQKNVETVMAAGYETPPPSKLPFDAMYIGVGNLVWMDDLKLTARFYGNGGVIAEDYVVSLNGFVCGFWKETFVAFEILQCQARDRSNADRYMAHPIFTGGAWDTPYDLNPWILNAVIAMYMEHKTTVLEHPVNFEMRRKFRKGNKGSHKINVLPPRPYYTLTIRDQVIDEAAQKTFVGLRVATFAYSYRFDVWGHERCRIRRGELPIDPELHNTLVARGYDVYTLGRLPAEDTERLASRKLMPKSVTEWLAIQTTWVNPHKKGPADAPYIPALRKV